MENPAILSADAFTPVPGLTLIPDFVDQAQHDRLIQIIDEQPFQNDLQRRVQQYGYRYDYKRRSIELSSYLGPLPVWLAGLADQLLRNGWFEAMPDQVIVNEYEAGQGISKHVDKVSGFDRTIASLSLGSTCVMDFSRPGTTVPVLLEPRSLVILQGAARYEWCHEIRARKKDFVNGKVLPRSRRLSLTFRKVLQPHTTR